MNDESGLRDRITDVFALHYRFHRARAEAQPSRAREVQSTSMKIGHGSGEGLHRWTRVPMIDMKDFDEAAGYPGSLPTGIMMGIRRREVRAAVELVPEMDFLVDNWGSRPPSCKVDSLQSEKGGDIFITLELATHYREKVFWEGIRERVDRGGVDRRFPAQLKDCREAIGSHRSRVD